MKNIHNSVNNNISQIANKIRDQLNSNSNSDSNLTAVNVLNQLEMLQNDNRKEYQDLITSEYDSTNDSNKLLPENNLTCWGSNQFGQTDIPI